MKVIEFNKVQYRLMQDHTYPMFGESKDESKEQHLPQLDEAILKKLKAAGLFNSSDYEIYNVHRFVQGVI